MVNDVLSFQCEPGYTLQVGTLGAVREAQHAHLWCSYPVGMLQVMSVQPVCFPCSVTELPMQMINPSSESCYKR